MNRQAFTAALLLAVGACNSEKSTAPNGPTFANNPCSAAGVVTVPVDQATRVDCSNGGSIVTLAGNGASYLVVPQLATDNAPNSPFPYHLASGSAASLNVSGSSMAAARFAQTVRATQSLRTLNVDGGPGVPSRPRLRQMQFEGELRARARQKLASGAWRAGPPAASHVSSGVRPSFSIARSVGTVGSTAQFRAITNDNTGAFGTVTARLVYAGNNVLLYVDTLAPAGGFTSSQLTQFGQYFDQTLYPIDSSAFGSPTDIDQNGHVIMLMTPTVNALTTAADCSASGYVAGYFNPEDLSGGATDPNSNNGEIFYSIVPDPSGQYSCPLQTTDVGYTVPATFLHELQHLISYSQHVVVHGGQPEDGWLDEGMSIVAEEMGSLYYEQKCPGTSCRTDPSQIFPDSSQGFIQGFLYDSYQYALLPDTNSVTLHSDADDGFAWRGGDWLLARWLGDQFGAGIYRTMDHSTLIGAANIASAAGQDFPTLFANFGLALYTDSIPGEPRTTAPSVDRFVTRNVRQLWYRLWFTSGGSSDVPLASPLQVFPITADTTSALLTPGTMTYYRLDTPSNQSTVTLQFSAPGGISLDPALKPQLAIFRLPPSQ